LRTSCAKIYRVFAVVLALWLGLALGIVGGGQAVAAGPIKVGGKAVVANTDGDPIRIRRGAGTQYAALAFAYAGQTVSVLDGPSNDRGGKVWFKIKAPAATGWMMADFLEGADEAQAPAAGARANLSGTARVANTNGDPLRMRATPSTSGETLTLLSPGSTVTIRSGPVTDVAGIVWYPITAKGIAGWVMAQFLVEAPAAAEPAAQKESSPQAKPAVEQKPAPPTATPTPRPQPTAAPKGATSTLEQYRLWIEEARQMYPYKQTTAKMWAVMMCESGGNARASGGGGRWLGLFQYAPGTWGGSWNPYRTNSIWDARSQIFATAKAWSIGMQSHWSCYYHTAGR
jgi:uncharacterized protein YgiM (DUF1202 family)